MSAIILEELLQGCWIFPGPQGTWRMHFSPTDTERGEVSPSAADLYCGGVFTDVLVLDMWAR